MESNVGRFKLEECTIKITDGTHSTVKDDSTGNSYLLSCKNIKDGKIVIGNNERRINEDQLKQLRKRTGLQKNDVLITTVGTIGESAIVRSENINYEFQRSVAILRPKTDILNPEYLYYLTKTRDFIAQAMGLTSGSVQTCLFLGNIKEVKVSIPSLKKQKRIVEILSSLDDKIELNNEMNKTLEEMAQAIFKSWFVDFEPFKDGEFEESELGIIPRGWKTLELSELGNIITGKTPSKNNPEHFGDEYKFITPKDINGDMFITKSERGLSSEGYKKMKKNMHCKYSIGVSCIGSDLGEVYLNDDDGFTNQQINTLTLNNYKYYSYVYICLKNMKDEFKNMASGSAVPIINKTTFSKIKIVVPSEKYIENFYNKVNSIFNKILININQNKELKEIRDTLLPKLISGEIQI